MAPQTSRIASQWLPPGSLAQECRGNDGFRSYNSSILILFGEVSMRPNPVKRALQEGKYSVGTWLSLGNVLASRFLARAGFAWLTVDLEHGPMDWETACHIFGAVADAGCVPLARVPSNRHDHIKRALDNGAQGIVVPMVNSVEEARAAVAAAKYPPQGNRSVGGGAHALNFGTSPNDYYKHANEEILVVLQCEHLQAVNAADEIFAVPGIDAIFVGPNDLAASMRAADGTPPRAEEILQTLERILAACRRQKVPAGIHCFSAEEARRRADQGWQFLAINSELRFMLDGAVAALKPFREELGSHFVAGGY
jgi:4-hydroxy-2-oxoheptanedioate aldolase